METAQCKKSRIVSNIVRCFDVDVLRDWALLVTDKRLFPLNLLLKRGWAPDVLKRDWAPDLLKRDMSHDHSIIFKEIRKTPHIHLLQTRINMKVIFNALYLNERKKTDKKTINKGKKGKEKIGTTMPHFDFKFQNHCTLNQIHLTLDFRAYEYIVDVVELDEREFVEEEINHLRRVIVIPNQIHDFWASNGIILDTLQLEYERIRGEAEKINKGKNGEEEIGTTMPHFNFKFRNHCALNQIYLMLDFRAYEFILDVVELDEREFSEEEINHLRSSILEHSPRNDSDLILKFGIYLINQLCRILSNKYIIHTFARLSADMATCSQRFSSSFLSLKIIDFRFKHITSFTILLKAALCFERSSVTISSCPPNLSCCKLCTIMKLYHRIRIIINLPVSTGFLGLKFDFLFAGIKLRLTQQRMTYEINLLGKQSLRSLISAISFEQVRKKTYFFQVEFQFCQLCLQDHNFFLVPATLRFQACDLILWKPRKDSTLQTRHLFHQIIGIRLLFHNLERLAEPILSQNGYNLNFLALKVCLHESIRLLQTRCNFFLVPATFRFKACDLSLWKPRKDSILRQP
ncbi:hypothetical protein VP01_76g8 [Puccinia sorghi]|uniref:Uncharacterized protein n=1 Tax=Puccinia sorghi TaxID=27349 RepID=A0A0L6UDN6_9BASI|nr:hypothetical protein VP01_76g8 [Puccinia sorghi]